MIDALRVKSAKISAVVVAIRDVLHLLQVVGETSAEVAPARASPSNPT
jgi:hypothetical protein